MRISTTVLCLPVSNLERTLEFYRGVFGLQDAKIEDDMVALELPNLSLFLMGISSFESYSTNAKRSARMPEDAAPAIISCAVESREVVDKALRDAKTYGGRAAGPAALDAASGGYIGYVTDPDGHLWELVCPHQM